MVFAYRRWTVLCNSVKPANNYKLSYFKDLVPTLILREAFPESSLIEVQLWEAHVADRYGVNARFLVKHSVDAGPVLSENLMSGRISYRFASDTWFRDVKDFFIRNRIPVSVRFVRIESTLGHKQQPIHS